MSKYKFRRFGIIILLLTSLSVLGYFVTRLMGTKPSVAGTNIEVAEDITVKILDVNFENKVGFSKDLTALEATRLATNGDMITTGNGVDAFVIELMGKATEKTEREYWELLVNGETALMGAGSLKLKAGDTITWKISKF